MIGRVWGLAHLPPEIRQKIYNLYFGETITLEITIGSYEIEHDFMRLEHYDTWVTTLRPRLAMMFANKFFYEEVHGYIRTYSWKIIIHNCSMEFQRESLDVLERLIPKWMYPRVTSFQANVMAVGIYEEYLAEQRRSARGYVPPPKDERCLLQSFPLKNMVNLKSMHVDVLPIISYQEAGAPPYEIRRLTARQENSALRDARRVLNQNLRLTLPYILQHGGIHMWNSAFTAGILVKAGPLGEDLWKVRRPLYLCVQR